MNIKDIIKIQNDFDAKHGWTQADRSIDALLNALGVDTIGLVGEVGEFANLLKKAKLDKNLNKADFEDLCRNQFFPAMREELIDTFIYLIRLMGHLDVDIQTEYLKKVKYNEERFKKYEED